MSEFDWLNKDRAKVLIKQKKFSDKYELRRLRIIIKFSCWSDYIREILTRCSKYKPIDPYKSGLKVCKYLNVQFRFTSVYEDFIDVNFILKGTRLHIAQKAICEMFFMQDMNFNKTKQDIYCLSYQNEDRLKSDSIFMKNLLAQDLGVFCEVCGKSNLKRTHYLNMNFENSQKSYKYTKYKNVCSQCKSKHTKILKKLDELKEIEKIRLEVFRASKTLRAG